MDSKRISNQSDENAKYHLDTHGIKSLYEKDFDHGSFNNMSINDQLKFTIQRFPMGSKVYTNLNCKPIECTVLGYVLKDNGPLNEICNLLTDQNEVEGGWNWDHYGNTSAHPGWFYPVNPVSETHKNSDINLDDYSEVTKSGMFHENNKINKPRRKFKRKYYKTFECGDQHGHTHGIYTVWIFKKILGIYFPSKRYCICCPLGMIKD